MTQDGVPQVGDMVLYVTQVPHPGGGADMARIPAVVTRLSEDGTVWLTGFPPGNDPCNFQDVARSEGGRYGGWEPMQGGFQDGRA